ncbi:hypothetical protein KC19_1G060500 [Ceratodon purpureus]|uniref:Enoyl reductase (ER) domain-containing protein n=1 Tax=Ceratodon purpureus TaxID=3225 RepID=A0A8T0J572_CERPU|nr:hypothetical protein KC19_1G060500 [Ceratodon purpureus]
MRNRAVVQTRFPGKGECSLELVDRPVPKASPGTVVIRLTTRSVNPNDLTNIRDNKLQSLQDDHHPVIGSEGYGRIFEVGEGVTKFKVDQRVVPILYWKYYLGKGEGAWQDYVEVAEEDVVAVPSTLSDESAAQYLINPWTAYGLLSDVDVPQGMYLLQTAASSTIGRQIIQICKHWNIKTINVVRRDEYVQELKSIGADEVINSSTEDVVKRVKQITNGAGAYAAVDAVGGILTKVLFHLCNLNVHNSSTFAVSKSIIGLRAQSLVSDSIHLLVSQLANGCSIFEGLGYIIVLLVLDLSRLFMSMVFIRMQDVAASVQDGGRVFVYGTLGGWDVTVSKLDLIRNVEIKYYRLTRWLERGNNKEKVMRDVMRYLEVGVLVPNSGKKFDLEDFRAAICESERDARGGKVLLVS